MPGRQPTLRRILISALAALTVGLGQHAGCFEKKAAGRPDGCAGHVQLPSDLLIGQSLASTKNDLGT